MNNKIIIGSRGSELALWQANFIKDQLSLLSINSEIKVIQTSGDQFQNLSFNKIEGKGFFTKEIEEALLSGSIDLAVHSFKDLPTESPAGLIVAAVSARENPGEWILIRKDSFNSAMPLKIKLNGITGTSSSRRKTQLLAWRPDLEIKELRGNVPTRINKLREGLYDAIMLAGAGISRLKLDISDLEIFRPSIREFVPAPAQGVLALQIREKDITLFDALQKLNNEDAMCTSWLERSVLNKFEGGCQLPLGICSELDNSQIKTTVSFGRSLEKAPIRIYFEHPKGTDPTEEIVNTIKKIKPKKIFITKNTNELLLLKNILTANDFHIDGFPFIKTTELNFNFDNIKAEWIFFSSSKAVNYFFKKIKLNQGQYKIAAIGKGTENALLAFGIVANFSGAGMPVELAEQVFLKQIGSEKVFFPRARNSIRRIQKKMAPSHYDEAEVYYTEFLNVKVPDSDIYVFTSPSNVLGFYRSSGYIPGKSIAIGNTTAREIRKFYKNEIIVADCPDEIGLASAIFKASI